MEKLTENVMETGFVLGFVFGEASTHCRQRVFEAWRQKAQTCQGIL